MSQLVLINRALTLLGEKPLQNENQLHKAATLAHLWVNDAFECELISYPWRFALGRVDMADLVEGDGTNIHLPQDCKHVWYVMSEEGRCIYEWQEHDMHTKNVADGRVLIYTRHRAIEDDHPLLFSHCVSLRLAGMIVESLTQSPTKQEALRRMYHDTIRRVRQAGMLYKAPISRGCDPWTDNH